MGSQTKLQNPRYKKPMEPEKETRIEEFYDKQKTLDIADTVSSETRKVKDFLFRSFDRYIESLNSQYGKDSISVLDLPKSLISPLFGSGEHEPGFLINFGREKIVVVFYGKENDFTFVGRKTESSSLSPRKNLKLLQIFWKQEETEEYSFSDSTGSGIRTTELIRRIVFWGVT